mmetsp:Transcript_34177/g.80589  ORF Transcript_34177/g.80589 Transcript_34177/m.80589 type:complete len:397 (+) Transcript_34177:153-1343(+)
MSIADDSDWGLFRTQIQTADLHVDFAPRIRLFASAFQSFLAGACWCSGEKVRARSVQLGDVCHVGAAAASEDVQFRKALLLQLPVLLSEIEWISAIQLRRRVQLRMAFAGGVGPQAPDLQHPRLSGGSSLLEHCGDVRRVRAVEHVVLRRSVATGSVDHADSTLERFTRGQRSVSLDREGDDARHRERRTRLCESCGLRAVGHRDAGDDVGSCSCERCYLRVVISHRLFDSHCLADNIPVSSWSDAAAENDRFVPLHALAHVEKHRDGLLVQARELLRRASHLRSPIRACSPRCRLKNASDAFLVGKFNERFVVFLQRGCALLCLEQGECSETWKLYLVLENENRFYARISQVKLFRKTRKSLSVFCSHVSCRPGVVQRRSCESELEFQQQLSPRY